MILRLPQALTITFPLKYAKAPSLKEGKVTYGHLVLLYIKWLSKNSPLTQIIFLICTTKYRIKSIHIQLCFNNTIYRVEFPADANK